MQYVLGVARSADSVTVLVSLLWRGLGFAAADSFYLTDPDVSVCERFGLQASVCPAYNYGFVGPEGPMLPGLVARAYSFFL